MHIILQILSTFSPHPLHEVARILELLQHVQLQQVWVGARVALPGYGWQHFKHLRTLTLNASQHC
jgi:hypothetical protein